MHAEPLREIGRQSARLVRRQELIDFIGGEANFPLTLHDSLAGRDDLPPLLRQGEEGGAAV
jgi:hypothetical protein